MFSILQNIKTLDEKKIKNVFNIKRTNKQNQKNIKSNRKVIILIGKNKDCYHKPQLHVLPAMIKYL